MLQVDCPCLAHLICVLGPMEIGSALSAATTVIRNLPEDPYPPSEPTFLGYIQFKIPSTDVKRPTMVESSADPVTRIACFKFLPTVTPDQKGNRTRAFLDLYAQHTDLILGMPKGGKPLHTPLALTGVKRESEWDAGFIVTFKVSRKVLYLITFLD